MVLSVFMGAPDWMDIDKLHKDVEIAFTMDPLTYKFLMEGNEEVYLDPEVYIPRYRKLAQAHPENPFIPFAAGEIYRAENDFFHRDSCYLLSVKLAKGSYPSLFYLLDLFEERNIPRFCHLVMDEIEEQGSIDEVEIFPWYASFFRMRAVDLLSKGNVEYGLRYAELAYVFDRYHPGNGFLLWRYAITGQLDFLPIALSRLMEALDFPPYKLLFLETVVRFVGMCISVCLLVVTIVGILRYFPMPLHHLSTWFGSGIPYPVNVWGSALVLLLPIFAFPHPVVAILWLVIVVAPYISRGYRIGMGLLCAFVILAYPLLMVDGGISRLVHPGDILRLIEEAKRGIPTRVLATELKNLPPRIL